jgi:hypothetical protein
MVSVVSKNVLKYINIHRFPENTNKKRFFPVSGAFPHVRGRMPRIASFRGGGLQGAAAG